MQKITSIFRKQKLLFTDNIDFSKSVVGEKKTTSIFIKIDVVFLVKQHRFLKINVNVDTLTLVVSTSVNNNIKSS